MHGISGQWAHNHPLLEQTLVHSSGISHVEGSKISVRRQILQTQRIQPGVNLLHTRLVKFKALRQKFSIFQRCNRARQRQVVAVEWLTHTVHQISYGRTGQGITDTQTGHTVDLGESTRDHQVIKFLEPFGGIDTMRRCQIFVIGFIQHHDHIARQTGNKGLEFIVGQKSARWIVRVSDPDNARVITHSRTHRRQIVRKVFGRGSNALTADAHGGEWVHRKRMCRKNGRTARRQKHLGNQFQHIIGTVTQNDLIGINAIMFGQRCLELKVIRVTRQAIDSVLNGCPRFGAHAQRVLIRCQLDDGFNRQTQLTCHFGNRLTGLIRCNLLDIR